MTTVTLHALVVVIDVAAVAAGDTCAAVIAAAGLPLFPYHDEHHVQVQYDQHSTDSGGLTAEVLCVTKH